VRENIEEAENKQENIKEKARKRTKKQEKGKMQMHKMLAKKFVYSNINVALE
jgi:hypothetical protein